MGLSLHGNKSSGWNRNLSRKARRFVPSHAPVTEDIEALARLNIKKITEVKERLLEMCSIPATFEKLLKKIFDQYGMKMSAQQYVLIGSTIRSYLSCLYSQGKVSYDFCDNEMYWHTN